MNRILLFVLVLLAAPALAQQYKWVDKDGKVRYGDLPPPGVKATPLKGPSVPAAPLPSPTAAAGKKGEKALTPEQAFQKRQKEQAEAAATADKTRADAEIKRANCDNAQSTLRQLDSGQRMSTMSSAGERTYMDDAQRSKETERARKAVSDWCS